MIKFGLRRLCVSLCLSAPLAFAIPSANAETLDSLRGRYAFNWHVTSEKVPCVRVDGKLLSLFKSNAYSCNLSTVTNTASGEPAVVCTRKTKGAEYLIFASMKSCEAERQTQLSNGD